MSVTEVGTPAAPAVSSGTNSPSVSPSWDASQTRTAGNYLVAVAINWGGTTGGTPGTPSGWTQLLTITGSSRSVVTFFGKVAAGSDSAPTIAATNTGTATFSTLAVRLVELTGVDTAIPVAASGSATGTTANPLVATTVANVTQSGCFALGAASLAVSASATSTLGAGSGWTSVADNGSTTTRAHWIFGEQSSPTSQAALAESFSYTTTGAFLAGAVVVFQPAGSMTVTATPDAASTGAAAKVYVVTHAAESGGTAGHTAGGPGTKSITPAQSSSVVLWANQDFFSQTAFTSAANNTIDEQFAASAGARYAHGHYSGTVTGGSAITVGATSADGASSALTAIYELIPSGGTPAIDGSTQPGQEVNGHTALVSYPFVPPNGAVLVVVCESTSFPANFTISDTHSLTWTRRDGGTDGSAAVYTATYSTSTNATATPSVVAAVASIGAPVVNQASPPVVPVVASIGSATVNTGEKTTPAVVAATATIGAASVGALTISGVAFGTGATPGATTVSVPAPAHVALNDLLLIWVTNATSTVTFSVTAGSSGWSSVGPSTGQNATATLFYKNADSTDVALSGSSGSYTLTPSASHSAEGVIILAPGCAFDPTPSTAGQFAANATGSSFPATGITTTVNGDTLLVFGMTRSGSGAPSAMTLPAGFTTLVSQASSTAGAAANVGVIVGSEVQTTGGATGNQTVTSAGATNGGAFLLAVTATLSATPTPSVVACAATIPTPTVNLLAPAVVPAVATIGSASVNTGEKVTPAVVASVASIGQAAQLLALRSAQSVTTGGGSLTLAVPAQPCAVGDLIFIWASAGFASLSWATDTGDSLTAETANSSSSPAGSSQLFHKIADSSDVAKAGAAGSYTLTISLSHTWNAVIGVVPVTSTAHPFDPSDTPGSGQSNASSNSIATASITTGTTGDLLVWLGADRAASGGTPPAITVPPGFTAACAQSNGSGGATVNTGLIAATMTQPASGATGAVTGSYTGTAQISVGLLLAIKAAPVTALPGIVAQIVAGAPSSSGFGVITKMVAGTSVRMAYSTHSDMSSPSFVSAQTPDGNGYMTHTLSGLSAATRYYVQAADTPTGGIETLTGPIGSCKTLAASGSPASFTVGLAACIAEQDVTSPAQGTAIADLVAWAPDLTIFTGDFTYSGSTSTSTDTQRGIYETQIGTIPSLASMVATSWGYYCRSDHEAGPDNGDSDNTYTAANLAAAQQVFPFGTLGDTVNTPPHGLYQSWVVGRVRFIMIDIRNTDRSPGANTDNGTKTMLGATQLAWLESMLIQSEPLKVIISDVAWMGAATTTNGPDKWWSYDTERQAIISYIAAHQAQVQNLMLWHGDSHLVGYATAAKNT